MNYDIAALCGVVDGLKFGNQTKDTVVPEYCDKWLIVTVLEYINQLGNMTTRLSYHF